MSKSKYQNIKLSSKVMYLQKHFLLQSTSTTVCKVKHEIQQPNEQMMALNFNFQCFLPEDYSSTPGPLFVSLNKSVSNVMIRQMKMMTNRKIIMAMFTRFKWNECLNISNNQSCRYNVSIFHHQDYHIPVSEVSFRKSIQVGWCFLMTVPIYAWTPKTFFNIERICKQYDKLTS